MNIFELIFFVANCVIGTAIARHAYYYGDWIGGVLGFIAGFAILPIVFMLLDRLLRKLQSKRAK